MVSILFDRPLVLNAKMSTKDETVNWFIDLLNGKSNEIQS